MITIREAKPSERDEIIRVESEAFGGDAGILTLVSDLLNDPTAQPRLSLLAFEDQQAVGHVFFTHATLDPVSDTKISLLAPLAVVHAKQKQGIGGQLIQTGLRRLAETNVGLVFVLGHPSYYPREGFTPAGIHGLHAPYEIPKKDAGAWMVQALQPNLIGKVQGTLRCAQALDKPEYWRE